MQVNYQALALLEKREEYFWKKRKNWFKKSIFTMEQKIEKKEKEEKVYRKDKNGTDICKKNKNIIFRAICTNYSY